MTPAKSRYVFKIATRERGMTACQLGAFAGSADDVRDGFIHLSAAHQLAGTLAKHFKGQTDLVLITLDADALGDALRWEPSRDGDLFPHLYGAAADGGRACGARTDAGRQRRANGARGYAAMLTQLFDLAPRLLRAAAAGASARGDAQVLELGLFPRAPQPGSSQPRLALSPTSRCPIRSALPRASTRMRACPMRCCALGCGFAEVGTVTPRRKRQPAPARLPAAARPRRHQSAGLQQRRPSRGARAAALAVATEGVIGVNIGANKDAADRIADYVAGLERSMTSQATSPSTFPRPTRRACATCRRPTRSMSCLTRADGRARKARGQGKPGRPIVVKLSPDIAEDDLRAIVARLVAHAWMASPSRTRRCRDRD